MGHRYNPHDPQQRMERVIGQAGMLPFDMRVLRRLEIDPAWPKMLEDAERSIRRLRTQLEALMSDEPRVCANCRQPMGGRADRKFCSNNCRQAAHKTRRSIERRGPVDPASLPPSLR